MRRSAHDTLGERRRPSPGPLRGCEDRRVARVRGDERDLTAVGGTRSVSSRVICPMTRTMFFELFTRVQSGWATLFRLLESRVASSFTWLSTNVKSLSSRTRRALSRLLYLISDSVSSVIAWAWNATYVPLRYAITPAQTAPLS